MWIRNSWRTLSAVLALGLALASAPALAAKTTKPVKPVLVTSSSTGEAKTARLALIKQHNLTLSRSTAKPGKMVGTTARPMSRTIAPKRILPK
jgi:hypothetical protein